YRWVSLRSTHPTRSQMTKDLQQFQLLRRDRIAGTHAAALDHLGIDPAVGMAEPALQRLRDGEVARGRIRIDIDGSAADDALYNLQPDVADRKRPVEQVEFVPRRPALDIEIGAEAQRMNRRADHVLDSADAGEVDDGNDLAGDVGKTVAGAFEHLGRALD